VVVLEPSLFVSRRAIAAPRLWAAFVDPITVWEPLPHPVRRSPAT